MIEKIQKYIADTPAAKLSKPSKRAFSIGPSELNALADTANKSPLYGVILAFKYGRAKGLRAGRREAARKTT